jgi:hypothetical protein
LNNLAILLRLALFASLLALAGGAAPAAEWPQFRGPDGQGHAQATDLPLTWSEQQNVAWKTAIAGRGWSSPVVEGRQVWLTTALDDAKSLRAVCVDRDSGKVLHDVEVFRVARPPTINAKNSYASPTPVIEAGRLFVHYGTLGTACLDAKTGKIVWKNDQLKLDHKEGPGSSPILWQNLLIVNCDGIDVQFVVALDKQSGELRWKMDRPGPLAENPDFRKAYSTPLVVQSAGRDLLISTGADQVIAYEPATGRQHWRLRYEGFSNVPRPICDRDLLYICTGYMRPQLWAVRLGSRLVTAETVLWRVTRQVPANSSPILVGQRLYMVSDQGVLTCLDAQNGREIWKSRLAGNFSASPLLADGRLYFASEEGAVFVCEPADSFKLLATNQLDGRIMASPAAVGRAIYLRSDTHLYRLEKTGPAAIQQAAAP